MSSVPAFPQVTKVANELRQLSLSYHCTRTIFHSLHGAHLSDNDRPYPCQPYPRIFVHVYSRGAGMERESGNVLVAWALPPLIHHSFICRKDLACGLIQKQFGRTGSRTVT